MSNDLQLNDAVRVKDTCEHEHWRGFVGYVFDLGNTDGEGKIAYTTDGHIGVCFDMDNTHRSPRGFKAEDLEKVGDYETFARFSLGYAVQDPSRFCDGYQLMKLAYMNWNAVAGNTWVDSKVLQLHAFLEEKYGIYIPRPWDDMPRAFDDVLKRNAAGEFDGGDGVGMDFKEALREAAGLNDRAHRSLWDCINAFCEADTRDQAGRAFLLRKYVATLKGLHINPHRDPQPKPGELAAV
jgi:hypothetical protein